MQNLLRLSLKFAALTLFRSDQPLATAILYLEQIEQTPHDLEAWCGLGSALGASAGVLNTPCYEAAVKSLKHVCTLTHSGNRWDVLAHERLNDLASYLEIDAYEPLTRREFAPLHDFLFAHENILS